MDLEVVWGDKSELLELEDGEHTVGRARENAVQIPENRVSKFHAVLRIDGDHLFVRDLGSTNGTEVGGKSVGKEEIEVGETDAVRFAGVTLQRSSTISIISGTLVGDNEISSHLSYNLESGYSDAARARIVDISSGLFELLASDQTASEVQDAACRFVATCVSADRVVLMEDEGEGTMVQARARWTRVDDEDARLRLSSTIVGHVISNRDSILVSDALTDPKFTGHESIVALNLRSAMAVPLFDNERVRGILYVDTADPQVHYGEEDLQVITATANAVAVKLRNLTLEGEMRTAARIQQAMLPENLNPPPGYELEAHQLMCRAVGGDLYHCLPRPNGNYFLAVGDVAGKGMPAALAMTAAMVLIGLLAEIGGELKDLMEHMHRQLFRSLAPEQFITLFLGELEGETGILHYVNAGHDPPLLVHKDGSMDTLDPTGMAVAMIEEPILEQAKIQLQPGDLLTVFTDGIPEATTNAQEFLGLEPVEEILVGCRDQELAEIREKIIGTVESFLGGVPASDDVTLMLLRRGSV